MINNHQYLENDNSYEDKHIWKTLLTTPEGHILEIGLIMALLFIVVLELTRLSLFAADFNKI
ncbi:MAG: hypothetical protein ACE5GV_15245 [Candidatus Scalindua sp.]